MENLTLDKRQLCDIAIDDLKEIYEQRCNEENCVNKQC